MSKVGAAPCQCKVHACAGAQVLRLMRQELFRCLLMGRIEFFDAHSTTQLTQLISVELDALRALVFGNVSRDRGARAVLEAVGSVLVRGCLGGYTSIRGRTRAPLSCCQQAAGGVHSLAQPAEGSCVPDAQVLFVLSWRLGPVLALVVISTAATAALYKKQTKVRIARAKLARTVSSPIAAAVAVSHVSANTCMQVVERSAGQALAEMVAVADQAFRGITTVRCAGLPACR